MNSTTSPKNWIKLLGPGLLFAGAAVGVSHLVLSTKAGAVYGFGLIWLVILANLMKYPFFEFGPRYAISTGKSLLQGYQKLGNWVLIAFGLVTLVTMFTVQAAVTIVTAGLASHLFGLSNDMLLWSIVLLTICMTLLLVGKYSLLDQLMKWIIITLTILTIIAAIIAYFGYDSSTKELPLSWNQFFSLDKAHLLFFAIFTGWMPAPMDLSVWHSLWALEKKKANGEGYDVRQSIFDFNVGYFGTTILALFFVALGALVMYGSGDSFSPKAGEFAGQLINLYTKTLGKEAGLFVAVAAFITMFSTTITCLDALPRSMAKAHFLLFGSNNNSQSSSIESPKKLYWIWMLVLVVGTIIILGFFKANMASFVQVATILSFVTTPFFALANFSLVFSKEVPNEHQPSQNMRILSNLGIVFLFGFAILYLLNAF